MAIWYVDYEGGNDANDGSSFALRRKTLQGPNTAQLNSGDTIRVAASKGYGSMGQSATWTFQSANITLTTAVNSLVDDGDTVWNANTNITAARDTSVYRTSANSESIAFGAAFTIGPAAWKTLAAATDYSAYQGLTLWFRTNTALAANTLSLRLCSDAGGNTTVDTFPIPAISVVNLWVPLYIDKGSALGPNINSIAIWADVDPGTPTVWLDTINTVKSSSGIDNLNLTSLISKNVADEGWYPVRGISGTLVVIDSTPRTAVTNLSKGYAGNTESAVIYKVDPTQTIANLQSADFSSNVQWLNKGGAAGSLINVLGGWNRSDMSTQNGVTWFDGMTSYGFGVYDNGQSYFNIDKINTVRYTTGTYLSGIGTQTGNLYAVSCTTNGFYLYSIRDFVGGTFITTCCASEAFSGQAMLLYMPFNTVTNMIDKLVAYSSGGTASFSGLGIVFGQSFHQQVYIKNMIAINNGYVGINPGTAGTVMQIDNIAAHYNGSVGLSFTTNGVNLTWKIGSITANNNGSDGVKMADGSFGGDSTIEYMSVNNNAGYGWELGQMYGPLLVKEFTSNNNTGGIGIYLWTQYYTTTILKSTIAEATKVNVFGSYPGRGQLILRNFNGVAKDHLTYYGGGSATIRSNTSVVHTAGGLSWRFSVASSAYITQYSPVHKTLGRIAVGAGTTITMSLWVYRDNTGITASLVVPARQIAGEPTTDVVATAVGAAGVWEQLSLTFTPTETGTVEVEFQCYGGTTFNVLIDDFSVSQG